MELDVTDFGARGDGETPDGDAVRRALAALPAHGGRLRFPPGGSYLLDSVEVDRPGVTVLAVDARIVKAPEPAWHVFHDHRGRADGFRCVGGTFDMARRHFQEGETVSPFFFVRNRGLSFEGVTVRDGIEEGIKLYTCRDVHVLGCVFENLRNNGVQFHAPEEDGFAGDRPLRDARGLRVSGCRFRGIDDRMRGLADGIGVAVHSTSTRVTVRDVEVTGCTVEDSVRGLWAEFNTPGNPGRDVHFHHNTVIGAHFHGLGLVGVLGGSIRDNRVLDTGRGWPDPPRSSNYTAAVIVSGSRGVECEDVEVLRNDIRDRRPPGERRMQYGIVVTRGRDLVVRGADRVEGATEEALHLPAPDLVHGRVG